MKTYTIEEIERLMDGITPGEWCINKRVSGHVESKAGRSIGSFTSYFTNTDNGKHIAENYANAQFIAAAPSIIRSLLAQLREKERVRK